MNTEITEENHAIQLLKDTLMRVAAVGWINEKDKRYFTDAEWENILNASKMYEEKQKADADYYYILNDQKWQRVDKEAYSRHEGAKLTLPPNGVGYTIKQLNEYAKEKR